MAYRLYFTNSAAGFTPSGFQGSWGNTSSAVIKALGAAPSGTATTVVAAKTPATNPFSVCFGRWVSAAVANSGTLSGVVNWVVGALESNVSANDFIQVHIYATVGSSSTVRGTLLTNSIETVELDATAKGRAHLVTTTATDLAISSVDVVAGDLIVVEIGYQSQAAVTTESATMNYGATGTVDLVGNSTSVTTNPGWIQFSDPNHVFADVSSGPLNLCKNPSAGAGTAAGWTSANSSGTAGSVSGTFTRTTGINFTVTTSGGSTVCGTPKAPIGAGEFVAVYVQYACSISRSGTIFFNFTDANGAFLSPNPSLAATLNTSAAAAIFGIRTAPSNVASVHITVEGTSFQSGDIISVSCVRYDHGSIPGYADGDSLDWVWDGTAEVSPSHKSPTLPPTSLFVVTQAIRSAYL